MLGNRKSSWTFFDNFKNKFQIGSVEKQIVELNTSLADALGIKTMWGNRLEENKHNK